jgi:hypothetical protein
LRLGRQVFWPRPALYAPCGLLRNRSNVFASDHEVYIDGFPRSGNTFALKAFQLANPGVRVRSHRHIPTFIVQSVRRRKPGMVLLRQPMDAASSWSIHHSWPLRKSLAYYVDFHSVLLKYHHDLFFVAFEKVIADFGRVITDFNGHWGTNFAHFDHTPQNVARCFAQLESEYPAGNGKINELRVPRPSNSRVPLKQKLLSQMSPSGAAAKEFMRADELYRQFLPDNHKPRPSGSPSSERPKRLERRR